MSLPSRARGKCAALLLLAAAPFCTGCSLLPNHRLAACEAEKQQLLARIERDQHELQALAIETSEAERRAQDAERELMEWKKVNFMAQHLGDEFEALIISLTKHGFFVELTDLFVEGFVPVDSLEDDRYVYRERQRAMVGQHTKRSFGLGERVRVRLDRVDRMGNKLQFSVLF